MPLTRTVLFGWFVRIWMVAEIFANPHNFRDLINNS